MRLYNVLFKDEDPSASETWLEELNPDSLQVRWGCSCQLEGLQRGCTLQLDLATLWTCCRWGPVVTAEPPNCGILQRRPSATCMLHVPATNVGSSPCWSITHPWQGA